MGVADGSADVVGMAEEQLDLPEAQAPLKQMGGIAVPQ
jgi:hypothetical protein